MKKTIKKATISIILTLIILTASMHSSENVMAKTVKTKGWYSTYTCTEDPYKMTYAIAKKMKMKGNNLTVYGTFEYKKSSTSSLKKLKAQKRTFIISKKCKFYSVDWEGNKGFVNNKISKSKFKSLILPLTPMPCCIIQFKVENGKIVKMEYGQG